jgi:hypothetical protein
LLQVSKWKAALRRECERKKSRGPWIKNGQIEEEDEEEEEMMMI